MNIIVGSFAAKHWRLNRGKPRDLDVWYSELPASVSHEDAHEIPLEIMKMIDISKGYAKPDDLYTIKCSHLAWDIKWDKTKADVLFMKAKGCKLKKDLYIKLKEHWKEVHGNKDYLSLNKNKDEFFNDFVEYKYDHDYLHELVAYPNKPMYTRCLKDNQEVLIDKTKFDMMSFEDQITMFREEIVVIACERWVLLNKNISWFKAYMLALKKVITSLTKGWATDFMIENLELFVKPDYNEFEYLLKTIEEK